MTAIDEMSGKEFKQLPEEERKAAWKSRRYSSKEARKVGVYLRYAQPALYNRILEEIRLKGGGEDG